MRIALPIVAILATTWLPDVFSQQQALFVKRDAIESGKRVTRQTSADQMVQNILQWLQGVYTQNSRRIRQGSFREYLPPSNTQKPRPFEPQNQNGNHGQGSENNFIGYPPAGFSPQPSFPDYPGTPGTSGGTGEGGYHPGNEITPPGQNPDYTNGYPQTSKPGFGYVPPYTGSGTSQPRPFPTVHPTGHPSTEKPGLTTGYPGPPPTSFPGYPEGGPSTGYPSVPSPGYPGGPSTGYPGGSSTGQPGGPPTGYPGGPTTGYPGGPGGPTTGYPGGQPGGPTIGYPGGITTNFPGELTTSYPGGPTIGYPGGPTTFQPGGHATDYPGSPTTVHPEGPTIGYPGGPPTSHPGGPTTGYPGGVTTGYPGGPTTIYPGGSSTSYPGGPTSIHPGGPTIGYPGGSTTEHPGGPITGYPVGPTTGHPGGPTTGYPGGLTTGYPGGPTTGYPGGPTTGYPGGPTTGYPGGPIQGYPGGPTTSHPGSPTTGYPGAPTTGYPGGPTTGYPGGGPTTTYPGGPTTGYPTEPSHPTYPPVTNPSPTHPPFTNPTHPPTEIPTHAPTETPTHPPPTDDKTDHPSYTSEPIQPPGEYVQTAHPTHPPSGEVTITPGSPEESTEPGEETTPGDTEQTGTNTEEDLKHPPHIHDIDVECAKDMMTINIEFNRKFDGIIYSKGFYKNPDCKYVQENSGLTKYKFTVSLNSCGTEFINAFDTQGKSYLENVLVLQNEEGIQEVWDTIRSVRCLWEGNLNKALSVALSVGMLTQEIVTFSGDTAMAKLDIQMGKGPFAPAANGLVKIGEIMTLVVSVSGDPGFDIQVKDCRAKDSSGHNVVALTDENGCVLKPKLFGAFQKTRNTQNTGASIIAYAFFNAFKFPDVMDLMIECNVELCKTDCEVCTDPQQKLEPGRRRRRDLYSYNQTLGEPVTVGKRLRVILPEDLSTGEAIINLTTRDEVCMSTHSFIFSSTLLISLLTCSSLFSAYFWLQNKSLMLHKH